LQDRPREKWHKKIDPVKLAAYYEENPDRYLSEAAEAFGCSIAAIFKAKVRLGIVRIDKRFLGFKPAEPSKIREQKKTDEIHR